LPRLTRGIAVTTLPERFRLLHGPYTAPAVRRGGRLNCLVRDCEVVVTSWTDARLPWPRGYPSAGSGPRGSGLVVEGELARAVCCESAAAIGYWWGVSKNTVTKYRQALGVTLKNNESTYRLLQANAALAREVAYQVGISEDERTRRSKRMYRLQLWRMPRRVGFGRAWAPEEVALLGTLPDPEVARRTGRTAGSVHGKRRDLQIPPFCVGRPRRAAGGGCR
jgi:hypothetical protein